MNSTICDVTEFVAPSIQCDPSVWCTILDWAIGPSRIRCVTHAPPSEMWMDRVWYCVANRAYVFDTRIMCSSELCVPVQECAVHYGLASTVYAVLAFFTFLCALVTLGLVAYYILVIMPMRIKLPYITFMGNRSVIRYSSVTDLRTSQFRPHHI